MKGKPSPYRLDDCDGCRALHRRLEQVTTSVRRVGYDTVEALADAYCAVMNHRTDLRDQLAQAKAEIEDWRSKLQKALTR
jgi:spore cortex formation protein SpoVR/YcgB (stage V sporulation)